jgi:hypothetical protein
MNKFSKVTIGLLLGSVAISSLQAESLLVFNGVDTNQTMNGMIASDIKSSKLENVNLTFKPKVNGTKGSTFELQFDNGGFEDISKILMCSQNQPVGLMYSQGDDYNSTAKIMPNPRFQFNSDVNESLIVADSNITFHEGDDDCTRENPAVVSNAGSCSVITALISEARTTTGLDFNDYITNKVTIGKTKKMVQIACQTPVCTIDASAENKLFTTSITPSGINKSLNVETVANRNAVDFTNCPSCEEAGAAPCTVVITVKNDSTEVNLTNFTIASSFKDVKGVASTLTLDNTKVNGSAYNIGSTLKIAFTTPVSLGNDQNITLVYTPNKTSVLNEGSLTGSVTTMDTTAGLADVAAKTFTDQIITKFQAAGTTKFIVPYMNSSYKTFVKITTMSDKGAKLSAVITDQNGKTADVTLADIGANGTVYLFSTKGPLFDAAKAAGLASAWTVQFDTTAAASVVSYMTTANGERRVEAY